jgi:hypothetical protein
VLVAVVGVVLALVVLFHSHGTNRAGSQTPTVGPTVGNFAFTVRSVRAVPTGKTAHTGRRAKEAATGIERTLDALYFTAFLDPSAWQSGNYGSAWRLFSASAAAGARKQERTLTLGSRAGSLYDSVAAGGNGLFIRVLMDPGGRPSTAVAAVRFTADATQKSGGTATISSVGEYYLTPGHRGWSISGYDVKLSGRKRR